MKSLPSADRPRRHPMPLPGLMRRYHELHRLAQDPVLLAGLLVAGVFLLVFIVWPLGRVIVQGYFTAEGHFSLEQFRRYVEPRYAHYYRQIFYDTVRMGLLSAGFGTMLGCLFAYSYVYCDIPGKRLVHLLALLPTISPPFAMALAAILLFGRNGLVTRRVLADGLGVDVYGLGFDLFGMTGLVFVQTITYFSVAYLILRGMLERLDPAMEEAAENLGASKLHVFCTITLPMLIPGLAGSFLLLFVESLADLGNPLFIAGNTTVLSAQIFIAINGEYDQQKGAALSLVLLLPTLSVFLLQRYWVSRRSYVTVTGKPSSRTLRATVWYLRWPCLVATYAVLALILTLYLTILVGSLTRVWGVDYRLDVRHYATAITRGSEAFMDTAFLSAIATPIAGVAGMVIAYLVVRKAFSGKGALDFASNLGGAVPGTILGIGYILAFIQAPLVVVGIVYGLLAGYVAAASVVRTWRQAGLVLLGSLLGHGLLFGLQWYWASTEAHRVVWGLFLLALGALATLGARPDVRWHAPLVLGGMGLYLLTSAQMPYLTVPLTEWGRSLGGTLAPKIVTSLAEDVDVFFRPPLALPGLLYALLGAYVVGALRPGWRLPYALGLIALSYTLVFAEAPLALVGTPYIIIAAYAVRSLPASVRAGVAALQQIDPAIEEASTNLGADTGYTFRRITLPLILPAFIAGLIFSFARHVTSLSAIIFLTTPRWRILTALILSEVEQGGMSVAAAYSVILIGLVFGAIGVMYAVAGRTFRTEERVDLALGAG
jgi:iron(III) transport system permease protein